MKVTHVLFDLDGLLINSEDIYTEQLIVLLNRLGKVYTHHAKRLIMGRKPIEGAEALRKEYDLPMTASEIATEYSKELPLEIWRKAKLLSGVQRLIEHLHLNSIPMAIATGSEHPQLVYKMWNNKDVWQLIHHVVASGDDPEVKPHFIIKIFLYFTALCFNNYLLSASAIQKLFELLIETCSKLLLEVNNHELVYC